MKNYTLDILNAVEVSAICAYKKIGSKDKNKVDELAVKAMNSILNDVAFPGEVILGEGVLDKAPMLYVGQKFSDKEILFDIAVDPVEGTNPVAYNNPGAITTLSISKHGSMVALPEMYMEKLFVSTELKKIADLSKGIKWNIKEFQKHLHKKELKVIILDKPRHQEIIAFMRKQGIHVRLINDGDVLGAIDVVNDDADFLYGIGGSPEGALMASLAISSNSKMDWKLVPYDQAWPNNEETETRVEIEQKAVKELGLSFEKVYGCYDLVNDKGTIFFASAITAGQTMKPVKYKDKIYYVDSIITRQGIIRNMHSKYKTEKLFEVKKNIKKLLDN